jgi:hypothetical protein
MQIRMGVVAVFAASSLVACGGDDTPTTYDYWTCALDGALVDASHLVRADESPVVEAIRADDPRAATFEANPIDSDDEFEAVQPGELALVGLARTDRPDEWTVYARATDTDGAVRFAGPCGPEFDRQFAALQQVYGGSADVAFLARMMQEALEPGRGADLRNVVQPAGWSGVTVSDLIAPRWEGKVRVVWLTVAFGPPDAGGIAGIQSGVGFSGLGVGPGVTSEAQSALAVVSVDGPAVVLLQDDAGDFLATPLDLAGTPCRDAVAMTLEVDVEALTATCVPAALTESQQAEVSAAQAALAFDRTAASPAFSEGPPTQE